MAPLEIFPGLRTVRNRAYRKLARVLDLEGTIHAGQVDISSVFLTHPLTQVVQAAEVHEFTGAIRVTAPISTTVNTTIRPFVPSDFDRYVLDDRPDVSDQAVPSEQDADWVITHLACFLTAGAIGDLVVCTFETSGGYDGAGITRASITGNLNQQHDSSDATLVPASGDNYYQRPMPLMNRFWDSPIHRLRAAAGGAVTVSVMMFGFFAPKGVIRLPHGS